jgi:hypothetical protein
MKWTRYSAEPSAAAEYLVPVQLDGEIAVRGQGLHAF